MKNITFILLFLTATISFAQEEEQENTKVVVSCNSITMQGANNQSAFYNKTPFTGKCTDNNIEKIYNNGLLSGTYKVFYDSGKLKEATQYDNNLKNGSYVKYNNQGVLLISGNFKNNLKDGYWKTYDEISKKIKSIKKFNLDVEEKVTTKN